MNDYASALLAAREEDYETAVKRLDSALENVRNRCSESFAANIKAPAHERIDSTGPVLLLASLYTLNGSILYRQQQWNTSLDKYVIAQKLLQRTLSATSRLQMAFLANCIGKCHLQLESYTEGIYHLDKGVQQALSIAVTHGAGSEEERACLAKDTSIVLAGLHTTLSCCYIQLRKYVDALVHAKFVHRRLEACAPGTDDYARASVLLAECMISADNRSRSTSMKALELLDKAAKTYRQLLKTSRTEGDEHSWEQRERILWLLNTYYLISRVLLFTNCKRDAELYAYKAEKLVMTMRLQPNDTLHVKVNDLIYWCRHGVPHTSSMRKETPDTAIESDLRSLLNSDARERLENDPTFTTILGDTAQVIKKGSHAVSKPARRPVSAPLLANPERFNIKPAQLLTEMDRKRRVSEGPDYYLKIGERDLRDGNNTNEIAQLIRRYKTTDIKPHTPLK